MQPDPLSINCPYCGAEPWQRCITLTDYARKPHTARTRLALVLAAHADPALDAFFPPRGPCLICATPGLDARHRVVDSIAEQLAAGEDPETVATELCVSLEAVRAVAAWAEKWGLP